jgi:peptidoglycan/xylan/chitin deacetylase (PgdA/CDA1 family)
MKAHYRIASSALFALIGLGTIAALVIGPSWGFPAPQRRLVISATPVIASPSVTPEPRPSVTPSYTSSPTAAPSATWTSLLSPTPTVAGSPSMTSSLMDTPTSTRPTSTCSPSPTVTSTPLPTPDGITRAVRVPILMYHHIALPPPGADAVRRDLSLPPEAFEQQLQYLAEQGYTSITLSDLIHHLARGLPLPSKAIILTFDDGYRDVYTEAFPLLRRYGMSATIFLVTGFIDREDPDYLSWTQVEEMHRAGMQFGSHSYTHPDLRGKPAEYLVWQILGSKEAIELRIQEPVRFFSYPSGMYDEDTIAVLRSAHFWGAVAIHQGTEQSSERPFELQRIRIRGSDTLASFAAKLEGDW